MGLGVLADQHAGVEQPARVAQRLDLLHHLVQLVAVLPAHVRRHHPAGAVLGLERAAVPEDQVHQVLGEADEAVERPAAAESFGQHEVDVAVLGVTEDHAVAGSRAGRTGRSTVSQVSSNAGTGTTMSSSSAVVPDGRAPATVAYRPLRVCHSLARALRIGGQLRRGR